MDIPETQKLILKVAVDMLMKKATEKGINVTFIESFSLEDRYVFLKTILSTY